MSRTNPRRKNSAGYSDPVTKSSQTAMIGVIFLTALCLGLVDFHAARVAEADRAALAKKRSALNAKVQAWEKRIAANRREGADSRTGPGPSPPRAHAAPDSRIVALELASYRGALGERYAPLYQTLGLSPALIARFEDLMTAHQKETYALAEAAQLNGLSFSDPVITLLLREEDDEFHTAQLAVLGSAGFQQLQQFDRLLPAQSFVDAVQLNTGYPPEPMDGAQAQKLLVILAHASSSYQNGGFTHVADVDWNAVLEQAQGILSPAQLEALRVTSHEIELEQLRKRFFQGEGL
jgi:hypothetical protein